MNWHESLPINCPPKGAKQSKKERFFRATTKSNEAQITTNEFCPSKKRSGDDCIDKGVSIFTDIEPCKYIASMPFYQKNGSYIAEIILNEDSGMILKTLGLFHFTWWKTKDHIPEIVSIIEVKKE